MSTNFNVERTSFDLDTFQQILEAMDGYHVLPWRSEKSNLNQNPELIWPWELPGMPNVSVDIWRYHVGFAVDRGFIECWPPDPYKPQPSLYYETTQFEFDQELEREEEGFRPPNRGTDAHPSSRLLPARLTYSGKEFVDNLRNASVKARAAEAAKRFGMPAMIEVVKQAVDYLMPANIAPMVQPER